MRWGCLKSWLLFRHPRELKIKSLYINDLIFNIAKKPKETVQKLKFSDSPLFAVQMVAQSPLFCGIYLIGLLRFPFLNNELCEIS